MRQSCAIPLSLGSKQTQAVSEFGEEPFKACVDKIKDYIFAGDCMQVVPSQRMSMEFTDNPACPLPRPAHAQPFALPLLLRFRRFPHRRSSPEILVRRERDDVIVRPIAGTRLRGKTPAEDLANEQDLLSDAKEIAEHVMLIDLGRNDVGRISKTGEVKVTDKMVIEKYSM
ncbi:chorismate-binding protein [Neisseria gonorrhoeae]